MKLKRPYELNFTYPSAKRMSLDPVHQIATVPFSGNDSSVDIDSRNSSEAVKTVD